MSGRPGGEPSGSPASPPAPPSGRLWWRRAVLDTSVLLSAHRHWLWLLARGGYYEGVWSPFIVAELARIRVERALHFGQDCATYRQRLNRLVDTLADVLDCADYRKAPPTQPLKDPDDAPILATALAGRAGCIVSLNTRDFPPGRVLQEVQFATPQEFLAALIAHHPTAGLAQRAQGAGRQLP